ncbi:hypothetical protein Taro_032629 [Colocasia esculenta]|uniref:Uncharacterized protein n=1 Tax=Colocasia esculenta TaxID=4460 RepID=A0A843W4H3_COLES|nr:hypothetical protein [Colocasia esculenta]
MVLNVSVKELYMRREGTHRSLRLDLVFMKQVPATSYFPSLSPASSTRPRARLQKGNCANTTYGEGNELYGHQVHAWARGQQKGGYGKGGQEEKRKRRERFFWSEEASNQQKPRRSPLRFCSKEASPVKKKKGEEKGRRER